MPFGVNDAPDRSRAILFAIEDASINTNSGRVVRDTIVKFLEGVSASDRIGLVTVPQATLRADLAPGGAKAREVAQQITGRAPASASTAESTCRTRDTLEALRNLLSSLAGADTPTTVLVFSGGLIGSARSGSQAGSGAAATSRPNTSSASAARADSPGPRST